MPKNKKIAKSWCKTQIIKRRDGGKCSMDYYENICQCEVDGGYIPINKLFIKRFGKNSINKNGTRILYNKMKI